MTAIHRHRPFRFVVDQHLAMDATGTLRLVFDADPWDSTISFAPGIPVDARRHAGADLRPRRRSSPPKSAARSTCSIGPA